MNYFRQIIFILIAAIASIAILPYFKIFGAIPNLTFLIMLSFLYLSEEKIALLWAALGGILLDLFLPTRFGLMTISFLFLYIINLFLLKRFFHTASLLLAILAVFINSIILNLFLGFLLEGQMFIAAVNSIYDTAVGFIIYYIFYKASSRKEAIKF